MISSYIVSLRGAYVKFSDNLARPSLFKAAPKTLGESKHGMQHQSIEPFLPTRATAGLWNQIAPEMLRCAQNDSLLACHSERSEASLVACVRRLALIRVTIKRTNRTSICYNGIIIPKPLLNLNRSKHMRILAADVGTGTQDILLFESGKTIENNFKLVMPSPTIIVAERIKRATAHGQPILLTGLTMGGGPSHWA